MKKSEVLTTIAKQTDLTKTQVEATITAFQVSLSRVLKTEKRFAWPGLGVMTVKRRAARNGRNPKTGKPIKIKAHNVLTFRPASSLKSMIT